MMNNSNYCVIMAGGVGSRFWPMSRTNRPKQFLDVLGIGQTLIQQTYNRFLALCPAANIYVVTNTGYRDLVLEQLPNLPEENIITEPARRNTAPCIAYANYRIARKNPDARIVVAPSDHLILNEEEFLRTVAMAFDHSAAQHKLVTLGIKPSRPDTGYGYIQFDTAQAGRDERIRQVKNFTEKPDISKARQFLASGDYYWNAGIFIWTLHDIQRAFAEYLPQLFAQFEAERDQFGTSGEAAAIEKIYSTCQNISIDYGIMEKAVNVDVVLSDFGWSDLGTWGSLYTHLTPDETGNTSVGKKVMLYECQRNIIYPTTTEKLVVIQGLSDYIVVDTPDVLLICRKDEEQRIKQFVGDLNAEDDQKFI